MSEAEVTSKVEELMQALDEVKRYRALSSLILDFAIIVLTALAALFAFEIIVNMSRVYFGFPCSFWATNSFGCFPGPGQQLPAAAAAGVLLFLIPTAGVLGGILWVDRKLRRVKVGEWKDTLRDGFPGAVKLLTQMGWDEVFQEIQLSKLGYLVYGAVKVVGYFILAWIVLFFPLALGGSLAHMDFSPYADSAVALALVLALSRKDLEKRYRQVWSLDALLWELRWFYSELGSARFKA